MEITRDELEATYRQLEDEVLVRRVASGDLTELACSVAEAEMSRRGLKKPFADHPPEREDAMGTVDGGALTLVARFTQPTEAFLLHQFLEANGVHSAVIGAQYMQVTTPWEVNALGGVRVMVPAALEREARDLLRAFESGEFALPDDFDADQK